MATKPTPEKLATMGMEYDENGFIRKIGTKVHPAVKAAEEAAINKPKNINQIEGYVDEPYPENINQEPIVLQFDGPVDGDEWAKKNEMAIADLVGAIKSKIGPTTEQPESNVSALLNKNMTVLFNANHESGFNSELVKAGPINYGPTTGFDIETEPAADSFKSALEFGQVSYDLLKKKIVKPKVPKSTPLKKNEDLFMDNSPEHTFTLEPDNNQNTERCLIAIDPGTNGSICFLIGNVVTTHKMPETPKDVFDLLKSISETNECVCYMEKVQGLPGMGGSPMFNFGKGYGHLEMALIALNIVTITTTPQKWQKWLGIGTKGSSSTTDWKNKLKAKAQQIFPNTKVVLWNADALLIGHYARNNHKW